MTDYDPSLVLTVFYNAMSNSKSRLGKNPASPIGGAGVREATSFDVGQFNQLLEKVLQRRALRETGDRQYLDTREISERLAFHQESVRRMIREGRLPATRLGKRLRVSLDDLEAFEAGHRVVTLNRPSP